MIILLLLVRATYMYGVVLHAHPVRGESHNQRNTTGEVATVVLTFRIMHPLCHAQILQLRAVFAFVQNSLQVSVVFSFSEIFLFIEKGVMTKLT